MERAVHSAQMMDGRALALTSKLSWSCFLLKGQLQSEFLSGHLYMEDV